MTPQIDQQTLQKAFGILFDWNGDFTLDRINQLKPDEVKTAYRKKALETHPDRAKTIGIVESVMSERFKDVVSAYEVINSALKVTRLEDIIKPKRRSQPRPSPTKPAAPSFSDHYYRGSVPRRHLLIGQFLYYCGIISWNTLIEAIVWQKQQRPVIGRIAMDWGILSARDVRRILTQRQSEGEFQVKFAEYAWQKGYISTFERMALLGKQRKLQTPIGMYFVDQGLLHPEDIHVAMQRLKVHNQQRFR